jgi:hypothetical protein
VELFEWSYYFETGVLPNRPFVFEKPKSSYFFKKNPLADKIGVRGFSKLGKSSFFVRAVLPSLA